MIGYIARRLVASFLILIGVTMVTFALTFMIPADPVAMLAGRNATAQTREQIRHQLGLDRPLPVQYVTYVGRLAVGDFGKSYARKTDVADLIASRLPPTLLLMLGAILAELMIGIPAGIYAASRRGSGADKVAMTLSFVTVSTPQFVVGLTLLYVFAHLLSWFPLSGYGSLSNLILPALTLGMAGGGWYSRMMRSSMIEVLRQDYIRTARAKGLPPWRIINLHALRNALIPVITVIGLQVGALLAGAILTETIFSWPGVGKWLVESIRRRDYPILQGGVLLVATVIILVNLTVDLLYGLINPRIRHAR